MRTALFAFLFLLGAAAFTIAYFGMRSDASWVTEKTKRVDGTVIEPVKKKRDGDPWVKVAWLDEGKEMTGVSEYSDDADANLKPGDRVPLLVYRGRVTLEAAGLKAGPTPFLLVGTVVCLLLTVYAFMLPSLRRRRAANRTSGLDVIVDSLKRTRLIMSCIAVGGLAVGGFCVWLGASGVDKTATRGTNIGIMTFGALMIALGLFMAVRTRLWESARNSWVMKRIEEQPETIAWFYRYVVTTSIPGTETVSLFLHFTDGKFFSMQMAPEDVGFLEVEIRKRATKALDGYSDENKKAYDEIKNRASRAISAA
jgi:hypothetical protein